MDAMTVNEKHFEPGSMMKLGKQAIRLRSALPVREKQELALDLAQAVMVFDEELGVAYEGYTYDTVLLVLVMRHYSDLDMTAYADEAGWNELHDLLASHGQIDPLYAIVQSDLDQVLAIYHRIRDAARLTFERRHSLSYKAGKAFASLLAEENLMTTLAKAEDINSQMIDMLGAYRKTHPTGQAPGGGTLPFGKRVFPGKEP